MVSIIILCHNKADYTEACLGRLLETEYEPLELIVVDNGSRDRTSEVLAEAERRCWQRGILFKRISNRANRGAVRGRNQAMRLAAGDCIAFMDNDVLVKDADWLRRLRAKLDERQEVGIVCPKLLFPLAPYLIEFAGGAVSRGGRVQYLGRGEPHDAPAFNEERAVQCTISACILFKRRLMEQIGFLDEAFSPVQYEDIDYSYRARAAGWKILYVPQVSLYHFENVTTEGSDDLNFKVLTVRNGLLFKRKWRHVFSQEDGPEDHEVVWKQLERKGLEVLTDGRV